VVILLAPLVIVHCLLFFLCEPPLVGDAIFGVVGLPKAMVLARIVHDLVDLFLVDLLLLIADEPTLCVCGPSSSDERAQPCGGLEGLAKPKGVSQRCVPEHGWESR
jgi:hypothetical protein